MSTISGDTAVPNTPSRQESGQVKSEQDNNSSRDHHLTPAEKAREKSLVYDIFRETFFGQLVYHASRHRLFAYEEELPGYVADEKYQIREKKDEDKSDLEKEHDCILVTWEGPDDPMNPINWHTGKRYWTIFCICVLTAFIYLGSSIITPAVMQYSMEFGVGPTVIILSGLTLFVLGYGIGPMILSPLTEIPAIGRNAPYIITLAIFVILQVPTALVNNVAGFAILRFLGGFFGSPPLATGGASISDLFTSKYRAYGLGIYGIAAVCGPVFGPLIGGFASQALGRRWTIWPLLFSSGAALVLLTFTMPETSATNILLRKAQRLRKATGNDKLKSEGEIMQAEMTGKEIVMMTLVRPITLTFSEPIVFLLDLQIGFVYALLYCWFEAFPIVFEMTYGFNQGELGLAFLGIFVGALYTLAGYFLWLHYRFEKLHDQFDGIVPPEYRLEPAFVGVVALTISLFSFGWTSSIHIHWIVPIICSSIFACGTFLLFASNLNYLNDGYPKHVASVYAGNDLFRACMGAAFPLFADPLFNNLHNKGPPADFPVAWGCTLLGGLSVLLIPTPFILYKFGPKIRSWSKYAVSQDELEQERDAQKKKNN